MIVLGKTRAQRNGGFSFVELLASVAILALLATVAVPFVEKNAQREKERELRTALRDIRQALDAYKNASVAGRILVTPEQSGYPPDLLTLVIGVKDEKNPGGAKLKFIRRVPRDPFSTDTTLAAVDTWGLRSFDSPPEHPAPGIDVFDVYSKSMVIGINGVPYSEW